MNRVFLLIQHEGQRRLLRDWLAGHYELVEPDAADDAAERLLRAASVDLGILDVRAVERLAPALQAVKQGVRPLVLPVLVIASRREQPTVVEHLRQTVDDVFYAPLDERELRARVEMMLAARRFAVALHARGEDAGPRTSAPGSWALEADEKRFRALVEHSYEAMTLLDPAGRVLYVSPSNARVFGRGPEAAVGMHWKDTFHPDFVEKSSREFGELLGMPGGSLRGEGLIRREDGEWRWMDVIATNMLDNPDVRAIVVNSRDVTDRKRTEDALRRSEERLQLAASSSNTGLWDWDVASGRVYYSPQWKQQLGYEDDEIGDEIVEWQSRLHPDDQHRMVGNMNGEVREGASTYEAEHRLRHKDGTYRWILSRGSVLRRPDGTAYRMLGVNFDITERKAAEERVRMNEERLRLALSIARMGTWEWDLVRNQLTWSPTVAEMFGFEPKSTTGTYEGVMSRVHHDDRHLLQAAVTAATEQREDVDVEFRALRPDGTQRWLASRARTFSDDTGTPVRIVGVNCDITERKQAEIALRESQRRLRGLSARLQRALEEERTRIAREIHDGLGQALTALKIDLSWLSGRLDRSRTPTNRALTTRTKAMIQLVDDTMQAVRRTATELRPVVLDDLGLQAAIEWQAREFEERAGIRCEFVPARSAPCADRDVSTAVFRIVQETLTNVARHAGATRVRITLREQAGALVLEVADDGRGITEAERGAANSLGLVGMRERARLLGGILRVVGAPGRGTKVIARIPLPEEASRQRGVEVPRWPA